ncbi:MAG: hypothetical protein E7022_03215 [Desulfovibrio desulfuricans]|nr:hypothetical protein [Desulfovibrio desulfuricans]
MAFEEASWRMRSAPASDMARTLEGNAMSERIQEWLATPEGTVANNPSWGHNLSRFKHDPLSEGNGLEVQIELALSRKMPLDIDDLRLVAVNVEVRDIDLAHVVIVHQYGQENLQIKL